MRVVRGRDGRDGSLTREAVQEPKIEGGGGESKVRTRLE